MATQDRLPTGTGATSLWTSGSAGNKWDDVDDPIGTPDEDTTYIYRADSAGMQRFLFTAFNITSSAVASIIVTFRGKMAAGTALGCRGALVVNGLSYTGVAKAQTGSYADYTDTWTTNPNTGAAWTEGDVEGTGASPLQEFGVQGTTITTGEQCNVTQVYCTVDYTEAGGGGGFQPAWAINSNQIIQVGGMMT